MCKYSKVKQAEMLAYFMGKVEMLCKVWYNSKGFKWEENMKKNKKNSLIYVLKEIYQILNKRQN